MYEHLVKNVKGKRGVNGLVWFSYDSVHQGIRRHFSTGEEQIGAIETWLKQPKVPTSEERARTIVEELGRRYQSFGAIPQSVLDDVALYLKLVIEAAIEADRKERNE